MGRSHDEGVVQEGDYGFISLHILGIAGFLEDVVVFVGVLQEMIENPFLFGMSFAPGPDVACPHPRAAGRVDGSLINLCRPGVDLAEATARCLVTTKAKMQFPRCTRCEQKREQSKVVIENSLFLATARRGVKTNSPLGVSEVALSFIEPVRQRVPCHESNGQEDNLDPFDLHVSFKII
ncbi:hypothetical protein PG988_012867 [Apiospora saccharicola]